VSSDKEKIKKEKIMAWAETDDILPEI